MNTLNSGLRPATRGGFRLLDQPLERQLLMGERGQVGRADAGQQLVERRVARHVGSQHDGVDEEADHLVECGFVAAGHRRAHHDVVAGAQPVQQHRDGACSAISMLT